MILIQLVQVSVCLSSLLPTSIALVIFCTVHHLHLLPGCVTALVILYKEHPRRRCCPKRLRPHDFDRQSGLAPPRNKLSAPNGTLEVGDGAGARDRPWRGHRAGCRTMQRRPTTPNRLVIPTRARVAALITTIGARPASCRVSEEDKELSRVLALSITRPAKSHLAICTR